MALWPRKKRGLYYLLPGMTRSNRIRNRKVVRWSIVIGIIVAAIFGFIIYRWNMSYVHPQF
ncbi:MAG: hypothetical protein DME26_07295 [Verrucomicrobia bacterium]|nr:MAG: hypothetical protein DME26_07295 [Verrucomicrobiota bacterium]